MTMTHSIEVEKLYTADEFEQMPEFHGRFELIHGRIVEKPMPFEEQSVIARFIIRAYDKFDYDEAIGRMLQETSVKLDDDYMPVPDISFWTAERKPAGYRKAALTPDLAIEIWSEHDYETKQRMSDARQKCRDYIANGVKLVWAVNPKDRQVEIYRPGKANPEVLKLTDTLSGEDIVPGFSLPVMFIFEQLPQ